MKIGFFAPGAVGFQQATDRMVSQRKVMNDLQQQMATGRKSQSFSGLGIDRRISLDARSKISAMESFQAAIMDGRQRVTLMTNALAQMSRTVNAAYDELLTPAFQPSPDGKVRMQENAMQNLSLAIDLLNTDHNGRFLFSGRAQDTRPVASASSLIDGGGGFPGLRTLAQERAAAEVGPEASPTGRLPITRDGNAVELGPAHSSFGFTINSGSAVTDAGSRLVADFDAVDEILSFEISGNLQDGDSLSLTLGDRFGDDYNYEINLIARTVPSRPGEFAIGATDEDTAENLRIAITRAIEDAARGALAPRAKADAIERYFAAPGAFQRPQIAAVDPAEPLAPWQANGLYEDDSLLLWYNGDFAAANENEAVSARSSASLRIDNNQVVGIGARANEAPFREMLVAFSQLEILRFENTPEGKQAFEHLSDRNAERLNFAPGSGFQAIGHQIASAEVAMRDADERHKVGVNMLMDMVDGVEEISKEEVAARILATQNRLEASYQTTAMLSRLTLLNYL